MRALAHNVVREGFVVAICRHGCGPGPQVRREQFPSYGEANDDVERNLQGKPLNLVTSVPCLVDTTVMNQYTRHVISDAEAVERKRSNMKERHLTKWTGQR
jgi:hypothetical protein